jgi:hypothetical protein
MGLTVLQCQVISKERLDCDHVFAFGHPVTAKDPVSLKITYCKRLSFDFNSSLETVMIATRPGSSPGAPVLDSKGQAVGLVVFSQNRPSSGPCQGTQYLQNLGGAIRKLREMADTLELRGDTSRSCNCDICEEKMGRENFV